MEWIFPSSSKFEMVRSNINWPLKVVEPSCSPSLADSHFPLILYHPGNMHFVLMVRFAILYMFLIMFDLWCLLFL